MLLVVEALKEVDGDHLDGTVGWLAVAATAADGQLEAGALVEMDVGELPGAANAVAFLKFL